jgi:hypothetical protein
MKVWEEVEKFVKAILVDLANKSGNQENNGDFVAAQQNNNVATEQ